MFIDFLRFLMNRLRFSGQAQKRPRGHHCDFLAYVGFFALINCMNWRQIGVSKDSYLNKKIGIELVSPKGVADAEVGIKILG